MGEKDLWMKVGLIVLIVGLSISFINPPQDKLKGGVDLVGGHSLLFEIDDTNDNSADLAQRVMETLKQRVDPGGLRNLVWRPIGRNRLEIQMPQTSATQRETRASFDRAREALTSTQISRSSILNALAVPAGEQREAAIAKMTQFTVQLYKDPQEKTTIRMDSRAKLFHELSTTIDQYQHLRTEANAAVQPASTQPASTQPIDSAKAKEMDRLFLLRNDLIDKLLNTNLDPRVLNDLLELPRKEEVRGQKIKQLKETHPDLDKLITKMVDTYEGWSKQKGMLDDPSDLMRLMRGAGKLEFRILAERDPASGNISAPSSKPQYAQPVDKYLSQLAKYGPRPQENDKYQWFEINKPETNSIAQRDSNYIVGEYLGRKYVLAHSTDDMGLLNRGKDDWTLRRAQISRDQTGGLAVSFSLDIRGGNMFYKLTSENIGRPLCIFLDDKAMSSAVIRSAISTDGQISGRFSQEDVTNLVRTLEAGVLPARLKEVPLQEKSVGPSLGESNIRAGLRSSAIALVLVIAFMAIYYTYNGVFADIAVLLNLIITLGIMAFFGNTFTMPGIAGIVLTVGMAVDANVLIGERIREELGRGLSAKMAVKLGYEKAFSAILDGHVTAVISALILAYLGSEEIKGFGQTLAIGLCLSMFTSLFVTRQYFHVMLPTTLDRKETSKCWIGTVLLGLLAGGFLGLGYVFNHTPDARAESNLVGLGHFLMIMFGTAFVLLSTMWLFRWIYRVTGHQRANRLPMFHFLTKPNIDWMHKYRYFWTISCIIVLGGMALTWHQLRYNGKRMLDIEFVGGTNVQIGLKPEFQGMKDEEVRQYVHTTAVAWLEKLAEDIQKARVTKLEEDRFNVVPADPKLTTNQMEAALATTLSPYLTRQGITAADQGVNVQFKAADEKGSRRFPDEAALQHELQATADYIRESANKMKAAKVQTVLEPTADGHSRKAFEIITTETSKQLVAESLVASMEKYLDVTQPIGARLALDPQRAADGLFPIKQGDRTMADVLGAELSGTQAATSVEEFKGGLILVFSDLTPATTLGDIQNRIKQMQLQPDFEGQSRDHKVIGLESAEQGASGSTARYTKVAVMTMDPTRPYVEDSSNDDWRTFMAAPELKLTQAALASSQALQRVTAFSPQVAVEATIKAVIAVILSMIAISIYIWVRFGSADFGVAGIIGLYHDAAVAFVGIVGANMFYHAFPDSTIVKVLQLTDFRVDLALVAALLTIVGFSINDTIVIFDRIRENRGRLAVSPGLVNRSVNETLSRTIITSLTVFLTVTVMYFFGGEAIHGFSFAMILGVITGTYSSIAIAPPLMMRPRAMWSAAIVLAGLTVIGLTSLAFQGGIVEKVIVLIVTVISVFGLIRVAMIYKGRPNLIMDVPEPAAEDAMTK